MPCSRSRSGSAVFAQFLAEPKGPQSLRAIVDVIGGKAQARRALGALAVVHDLDRKSTRLNSSHSQISYAVFCLKKKKKKVKYTQSQIWYDILCLNIKKIHIDKWSQMCVNAIDSY